jgi:transcriptional regulator with XRE-family HTH domain
MMSKSRDRKRTSAIDLRAIGRRIRELRGFDITQVEFSKRIGVAQSHLSALEHGDTQPCAEVLLAISQEFGRSVDWLLTGQNFVAQPKESSKKSSKPSPRPA